MNDKLKDIILTIAIAVLVPIVMLITPKRKWKECGRRLLRK